MTSNTPAMPVYWHDCPIMGPHTRIPQAVILSQDKQYVLGRGYKCFCGAEGGEPILGPGVQLLSNGQYVVDPNTAERVAI